MKLDRLTKQNRNIPGRADGYVFFLLRWPSGSFSHQSRWSRNLNTTIRMFRDRMKLIPPDELSLATGEIQATVRNQHGLPRRTTLAEWHEGEPLPAFFATAKAAWKGLPKETADQNTSTPIDPTSLVNETD